MKVLFVTFPYSGHKYSLLGLAEILQQKGHEVIFHSVNESGENLRFKTEILNIPGFGFKDFKKIIFPVYYLYFSKRKLNISIIKYIMDMIKLICFVPKYYFIKDIHLKGLIKQLSPDELIVDDIDFPSISFSGIPWVMVCSGNPSCYPIIRGLFRKGFCDRFIIPILLFFRGLIYSIAFLLRGYGISYNKLPSLFLYIYPKEINYQSFETTKQQILRVDASFNKDTLINNNLNYNRPSLFNSSKKIILVSFGSYMSNDVKFMKKIVSILSKSDNSFIVSKGVNHELYTLSRNMIGAKFLDQKQIYPIIDLVISHGGNNTFTEAFYFGIPQIIIPLAFDQRSNAQRISKFKLGRIIEPSKLTEKNLLNTINIMLKDEEMKTKISLISSRIQKENRIDLAVEHIENLITT